MTRPPLQMPSGETEFGTSKGVSVAAGQVRNSATGSIRSHMDMIASPVNGAGLEQTGRDPGERITTRARLEEVVESALRQPRVAVDLESNNFHRYPERVCLVQLATSDAVYIIDPLSIEDMAPLGGLLANVAVEKVFHSANSDLRLLDRDWKFPVRGLFDTSMAAAFLGSEKLGLAAVLTEYLGIEIDKNKKLQRADWSRRPLTGALLRYAALDVLHLDRLATLLHEGLDTLGRTGWVKEECRRLEGIRHVAPDAEWKFLSVKGSRDLDGRGLAVLRSLHAFRETEALRCNRPPFRIFSDAAMVKLAANPYSDPARVNGLGRYGDGRLSLGVRRAIHEGIRAAPVQRPRKRKAEIRENRTRLRLLKDWRTGEANRLKLSAFMLWPTASLARLSRTWTDGLDAELESEEVRSWQRQELGEALWTFMHRCPAGNC
ncbi:MAG: hypothetical protein F4Z21_04630 [Acidobacteria bacterium]|nr:hypothetical protein [Acidobacteriota bacterium]